MEKTIQKKKIHIVACDSFSLELNSFLPQLQREKEELYEIQVTFLSQRLHVDFQEMKAGILEVLEIIPKEEIIFLLYGSKCHPDFKGFLPIDRKVIQLTESNCIEGISGEKSEENPQSFYLNPLQVLNWKKFFSYPEKTDQERRLFREQFMMYCNEAVFLENGTVDIPQELLQEFSDATGLPVRVKQVKSDFLKERIEVMIKKL